MQGERDEVGESLLNAFSLKNFTRGMLESSACNDYLQKLGSDQHVDNWVDNMGSHQHPNYHTDSYFNSNQVNTWSIAPPEQLPMTHHHVTHPCNDILPSTDQYIHPNINTDHTKQMLAYQEHLFDMEQPCVGNSIFDRGSYNFHVIRPYNYHQEESNQVGTSLDTFFGKSVAGIWGDDNIDMKPNSPAIHPWNQSCALLSKPVLRKSLSLLETRKEQVTINKSCEKGKVTSVSEGNKKGSKDMSQRRSNSKKVKHEKGSGNLSTATSSFKVTPTQTPKVKIAAEKISALQQLVSPYGKTDTASVLQEAIGFIKCHQEQVQLHLSNPYLKSNANKLKEAWRIMDKKFETSEKNKVLDLKSKGLCLIHTSEIPQVFKENDGPDYWPTFRGCMYR